MSLHAPATTAATPTATAAGADPPERQLRVGDRSYPVVLPSIRDPRLHLAAVIITIHVLGQVALDFAVSVPQILAAILVSAVIEVVWTRGRSPSRRGPGWPSRWAWRSCRPC